MRHAMTRYVFEEVRHRAVKVTNCTRCGKSVRRAKTFTATINPWNVNEDGSPRSRWQILERLREKATEWQGEPESCTACLRLAVR
jgi:hypothetical protein